MKYIAFFSLTIILILGSCTKEYYEINNIINPESYVKASEYLPMAVGNEWIYKISFCDSLGENCNFSDFDTLKIVSDSIVGVDTFYKFKSSPAFFLNGSFRSDSIFIYDNKDEIIFCSSNNSEFIFPYKVVGTIAGNSTAIWDGYFHLLDDEFAIYVPAGVFPVVNFQGQIYSEVNNYNQIRYLNQYYSKDVGIVKYSAQFLHNGRVVLLELESYSLN